MTDATPATLAAGLQKAAGGDTIRLGPGDYRAISLLRHEFDPPVTITAAPDAAINSLNIVQCKGLILDGLTVRFAPGPETKSWDAAIRLFQCVGVAVRSSTLIGAPAVNGVPPSATRLDATFNVIGLPCARAMTVQECQDVTIAGNEMSGFHSGVAPYKVDGLTITDNAIHDLRTSPITGSGVSNAIIERNHLYRSTPWRFGPTGDHGDYIHLWTIAGQATPSRNIIIRDNRLEQRDGYPILGIYLDDDAHGLGFTEVEIAGNVIANADRQAIRLERVSGKVVRNTLVTPVEITDKRFLPAVMVADGSKVEISDNIMGQMPVVDTAKGASWTGDGNVIVDLADYPKVFSGEDYRALPGVTAGAILAAEPAPPVEPETPPQPETIEITLQPGQRLVVTGVA